MFPFRNQWSKKNKWKQNGFVTLAYTKVILMNCECLYIMRIECDNKMHFDINSRVCILQTLSITHKKYIWVDKSVSFFFSVYFHNMFNWTFTLLLFSDSSLPFKKKKERKKNGTFKLNRNVFFFSTFPFKALDTAEFTHTHTNTFIHTFIHHIQSNASVHWKSYAYG